jgi:opacity protein-like surface antigen
MKKLLLITLSLATAIAARAADVPEKADLVSMTESSLISFGKAVKKKDFYGFYDDIAIVWQKQTTAEKLEELFKDFLDKGIDLPAAIKEKEPVFSQPATINSDGVLMIKGYYPTTPNRIVFQLKYLQEEDEWKLVGIDVNLKE